MGRVRRPSCSPSPLAGVAAAKDGALASLETPIPPDADPGTKIDVAWRAWMPDAGTDWPFSGSPVFIRLVSADGGRSTETMGRESPPGSGRYEATIAIPSGGVGRVEVGLFGESCVERHLHALRPPVRAPGGPARSAGGGSSPGCARRDRGGSCLLDGPARRRDHRDAHGPAGEPADRRRDHRGRRAAACRGHRAEPSDSDVG